MKNIVSFSGGKDSTAMLLKMIENNMKIDDIIFLDTGKEFPQMYEHIKKVEEYIKRPITILRPEKSFDYLMSEHIKTKGKNKGKKGYGWARSNCRWCTSNLKNQTIKKYLKKYEKEGYIEYVGIAYDEIKRKKDKCYPLIDWKMTEKHGHFKIAKNRHIIPLNGGGNDRFDIIFLLIQAGLVEKV